MPRATARWGWILFISSVFLAAGCVVLAVATPPRHIINAAVLPWVGLVLSITAFFAGQFSYPRVHNLKVYLAGYLTGVTGIGYFLLLRPPLAITLPPPPPGYGAALHLLIFLNLALVIALPSFAKYRRTRQITLAVTSSETVLVLVARFSPRAVDWASTLDFTSALEWPFLVGPVWFGAVMFFALRLLKDEFHLGGVLAGTSLLYACAWGAPFFAESGVLRTALFTAASFNLVAGMIIHWFARMEHRIAYDPLLHIYNRNYCSRIISEQSSINSMPPFAVAMVDIDHFKKVNDTYGHHAGDQVLYATAQAVSRCVIPDGVACRYGGEELAVFFPQKTSREAASILENVRAEVEETKVVVGRKTIQVTISCGVSHREDTSQSIMDVINAADKALYRAKKGGRNQVKTGKTPAVDPKKAGSRHLPVVH